MDNFLVRKKRETPPNEPKVDGNLEAHVDSQIKQGKIIT
jgi:hypothetical protein